MKASAQAPSLRRAGPLAARLRMAAAAALLSLLAACGFQLRGATPLPFDSIHIGIPDNTLFGAEVRRAIRAVSPNTKQLEVREEADARLQDLGMRRDRREVSLNPQGRVEEYELTLTFRYRLVDRDGRVLVPDTVLTAVRELPYDTQVVQAKEGEMETLYRDMQRSLVDRIVRRLTAPDVREAAERAAAARAGKGADDLPVIAPDAPGAEPSMPADWSSTPTDFEAPGQYGQ